VWGCKKKFYKKSKVGSQTDERQMQKDTSSRWPGLEKITGTNNDSHQKGDVHTWCPPLTR